VAEEGKSLHVTGGALTVRRPYVLRHCPREHQLDGFNPRDGRRNAGGDTRERICWLDLGDLETLTTA
jgi:hypothetical protein